MSVQQSKNAADYIFRNLHPGDVLPLKNILKRVKYDYSDDFMYVRNRCRSKLELENFLREYPYLFFVDNGKVARYSEKLEEAMEAAVTYFKNALKDYSKPVGLMDLEGHIDKAPVEVTQYITKLYPANEFKRFFKLRPNIFVVFKDNDTVSLTERESVEYFKKILSNFDEGQRFMNLKGYTGQAPDYIRTYINECYPGMDFRKFFDSNRDIFNIDSNALVHLVQKTKTKI